MTVRTLLLRTLALLLVLYAAGTMCRTAADLTAELRRQETLKAACEETRFAVERAEAEILTTPEEIRLRAWRVYGLVSPEDVVFFDEGSGGQRPKIKEDKTLVWSLQ